MKMEEAMISCSPCMLERGKRGDSAQIRSGTLAMRVSVMELGKFTGKSAAAEEEVASTHILPQRPVCVVIWFSA